MAILSKKLSTILKLGRSTLSENFVKQIPIKRSVQTFTRNRSTAPAVNTKVSLVEQINKNGFDFENFGKSQEKIEVDGLMLNWDVIGSGEHVVLMLPGTLGSIQDDFGPLVPKMDMKKYTLVSWDPPGYGRSRPPTHDFTGVHQRTDAHLVVKLMNKLGFDKFSMIGWSAGATSGIFIAADYPSKVNRFVTISGLAYIDKRIVNLTRHLLNFDNWSPKSLEPLLKLYDKEELHQLIKGWHGSVSDMYCNDTHAPIKEKVPQIKCPTLIVHGGQDPMLGIEHAEFLRNNIPNSRMHVIPKGGHNFHLKYTDEFLKLATQFLDS